jgi:CBS domain-containing protein
MPIGEICNREIVVVWRNDTALEAYRLMRQHHIGNVFVVDERNGVQVPVGIINDCDLIMEIMAPELDGTAIRAGDIMSPELVTVKESTGIFEAIQYMRRKAVRRLPIVNESGGLVGILTLPDLLELLSEELLEIAKLIKNEHQQETRNRR